MSVITGRNEVLAKVIFLHLSVIHSVHKGGEYLTRPDTPPPSRTSHHPPPDQDPPGQDTPQTRHPPGNSRLRNTVNDRPVRILLECILVLSMGWGSLCNVTSCLAAWSHVPSRGRVSVSGPMFLQGGSLSRGSLSRRDLCPGRSLTRRSLYSKQ